MKILECMIAWTPRFGRGVDDSNDPTTGKLKVGPWPDVTGWSDPYAFTVGACNFEWHDFSDERRTLALFIEFADVIADGVDPILAHREFCKIDEYRSHIAQDIQGSDARPFR